MRQRVRHRRMRDCSENRGYDILMTGIASNVGLGRPEPGPTSSRLKKLRRDPHIFMRHRVRHRRVRDCSSHAGLLCLTALYNAVPSSGAGRTDPLLGAATRLCGSVRRASFRRAECTQYTGDAVRGFQLQFNRQLLRRSIRRALFCR